MGNLKDRRRLKHNICKFTLENMEKLKKENAELKKEVQTLKKDLAQAKKNWKPSSQVRNHKLRSPRMAKRKPADNRKKKIQKVMKNQSNVPTKVKRLLRMNLKQMRKTR